MTPRGIRAASRSTCMTFGPWTMAWRMSKSSDMPKVVKQRGKQPIYFHPKSLLVTHVMRETHFCGWPMLHSTARSSLSSAYLPASPPSCHVLPCHDYRSLSILILLFQLMMRPKARIRIKTTRRNLLYKREKSLSSRLLRSKQMNCSEKSKATNCSKPWQPVRSSLLRRDLES